VATVEMVETQTPVLDQLVAAVAVVVAAVE
jgi:hypothetical protein